MLLSQIILFPLLAAIILLIFNSKSDLLKQAALGLSLAELLLGAKLFMAFDPSTASLQLTENYSWISQFGISYSIGVDGLSFWLVLLTVFIFPIAILGSWNSINKSQKGYYASLFVLQTAMIGTFLSIDAILFYLFWELSLVPMYFIIGIWGGARRIYATVKFFIYTMAGSILMLLAMIYLILMHKELMGSYSANLLDWYKMQIPFVGGVLLTPQTLMFFAFSIAFAIKTPAFPVHTWLPDAHVEAPTAGSVLLAAVMLKMGTYGFVRWVIPLFPQAAQYWAWLFMVIGVIGIIYGALMALVQTDIKKLVAYSSVSHMGYVLMGLFALNQMGVTGALYQMLNHGISTGALFFLVGMIYERTHTRQIAHYGGLAPFMPWYTIAFLIITLSSIAVPMTNGFIGEFLILMGSYKSNPVWAYFAVIGVVLGAAYMLWMVKKVFYGPTGKELSGHKDHLVDLSAREWIILSPFIVLVFWMGLRPNDFLNYSRHSLEHWVKNQSSYTLDVKK